MITLKRKTQIPVNLGMDEYFEMKWSNGGKKNYEITMMQTYSDKWIFA